MSNSAAATLLRSSRITPTIPRQNILSICLTSKRPLTVADVASRVGERAHLATIYRTLEKFVSVGILSRIDFQEGKSRYEYVHEHHHHAVCDGCGLIVEVHDHALENSADHLHVGQGFAVTRHLIEFFGLCHNCQKKG